MKHTHKFNNYVSLLFLLTISTVILASYITFTQVLNEHGKRQQESIIPLYSLITKELIRPLLVAQYMANDEFVLQYIRNEEPDKAILQSYLTRIGTQFDVVAFIAVDKHDLVLDSNGKTIDLSSDKAEWYHRLKAINQDLFTDIGDYENPHLFIDIKIKDENNHFEGFVGVGVDLAHYASAFAAFKERFGYDYILSNQDNEVMLSSNDLMTTTKHHRKENTVVLEDLPWYQSYQAAQVEINFDSILNFNAQNLLVTKMPIAELKWNIFILAPENINKKEYWTLFIEKSAIFLLIMVSVYIVFIISMKYVGKKLIEHAEKDQLTNLPNRHYIDRIYDKLNHEYRSAAVIMADVDHFKKINDTYGHNFGDQILKMISVKLSSNLREKDKVARWGGEEFVLVLPETSIEQATDIANRIRVSIEQTQIDTPDGNEKISVTISFGIAISALNDQKIDLIIDQADMALYQAKSNGRNCVMVYKKAS